MREKVSVNPSVLEWARREAGLTSEEAAELLHLTQARLADLETGADRPTVQELHRLAEKYGVSTITLLLSQPLAPSPTPEDFRTVAGATPEIGLEGRRAIKEVSRLRGFIADLLAEDPNLAARPEIPVASPLDPVEQLAARERNRLQVSKADQLAWTSAREAFNHWRWRVEAQGVLVFVLSLESREFRGFSFWNQDGLPAIAINSRESEAAQSFTLFHEYAHLLRRQAALCNQRENTERGQDERFCNLFAANLLIPRGLMEEIVSHDYRAEDLPREWSDEDLRDLTEKLKVSKEACALRLEELDFAPKGFYRRYIARWEEDAWTKVPRFRRSQRDVYHRRYLNRLGGLYVTLTLTALERSLITLVDAGEMLGARAKHLKALRADIAEQRARYTPAG